MARGRRARGAPLAQLLLAVLLPALLVRDLAAQEPGPAPLAPPVPVNLLPGPGSWREEALLCYHLGAAFYVKLPHPVYGDQGTIYQRITPGAAGHMNAFQLRLHNNYPGAVRHYGDLQLSVHRHTGGMPGPFEQVVTLAADTIGNTVVDVPLPAPFAFSQGEEFYLGLGFEPAAAADTVAYVTAAVGEYTGHSFFFMEGQTVWWGDAGGTPFGDMHYCAQVWLDNAQPFLHFPWSQVDLGRGEAGTSLNLSLPLVNQGTAPLVVQSAQVAGMDWSCYLTGPDSLMAADTLTLHLAWQAPAGEAVSLSELTIRSNAANGAERRLPLRASSSTADLLLADWDEWTTAQEQLQDAGPGSANWRTYSGLSRPGPFMGHGAPAANLHVRDILAVCGLDLQGGTTVQLRWAQFQRHRAGMVDHAFCWRVDSGEWQVEASPDLTADPWLGPEGEWCTVPWLTWTAPASGSFDLGLLYGGAGAADQWFLDDLELQVEAPLQPPDLRIEARSGNVRLSWDPVLGADVYRIERLVGGAMEVLALTTETTWTQRRALKQRRVLYRVVAIQDATLRARCWSMPQDEEEEEAP